MRQVRDTPSSQSKLGGPSEKNKSSVEKNRRAVRRYILKRWIETGRKRTLVICQLEFENWLRANLPAEIEIEHYKNIVGVDDYKDVRLLFLIGRTQPGPEAAEAYAGALSGAMPVLARHRNPVTGFLWFKRKLRGVRLKDGRGIPMFGDEHPDALAEEIRWQQCEAELMQALGRARAIWRTPETPLDVELLFNTVLPVTVNEVTDWDDPSLLWETALDGVVLTSPVDLVKAWPGIWKNRDIAKTTIENGVPVLPGFTEIIYQLDGPKMNRRTAYFDLSLIPEPRRWLEERLGALKPL